MSRRETVPATEDLRERVEEINDGLIREGEYSAQEISGSVYSCLPADFVSRFDIESKSTLEIYEDKKLGCVVIFPKEAMTDE